ncbi:MULTISPECIES: DUF7144 family membrane protein [Amycolatopsis]|uniref:DUF7144 domain-containing protein n=1 Tax=Amycolatopsis thermoflava TaxID=84480 RepID=A0A3N2H742_9PSEU|nr:hypothetical protein [Amycolatopsis thermoflava]ROS44746.1 hypothetical protein EDD35_7197 [Amycolatopsis thermoflava]
MTQQHAQPHVEPLGGTRPPEQAPAPYESRSAWLGWVWFGGAMMVLLGIFNVIEGLVALFNDEYYLVGAAGTLVFDLTGWGWVHLIIGVLAVAAGIGLFTGAAWARVTAVVLATVNAVAQLTFLSAYPVWATLVIALDVVVIWAVVVHGSEARRSQR